MNAVLMLDLKKSKKYDYERRNEIQKYLLEITDILSDVFKKRLDRNLYFSGGDELQGLFKDPEGAFLCLRMFWRALYKVECHAGIGIGEWGTVIDKRSTFFQDGPVYHMARKAIDISKKEKDYSAIVVSNTENDPVINAMINGGYRFICSNSSYQNELAILFEYRYPLLRNYPLNSIALEAYFRAVQKAIKNNWYKTNVSKEEPSKKNKPSPILKLSEPIKADDEYCQQTDEIIFQPSHPYGAASEIAKHTGLKRQAVDTALRNAEIYTERSIALAIISELRRIDSKV